MNIGSVKSDVVPTPPGAIAPKAAPSTSAPITESDSFTPAQNQTLVNMLQQQPDVRPEALARAQALAADPNYPDAKVIENLAQMVIGDSSQE